MVLNGRLSVPCLACTEYNQWATGSIYPGPPEQNPTYNLIIPGISVREGQHPEWTYRQAVNNAWYMAEPSAMYGWVWQNFVDRNLDAGLSAPPFIDLDPEGEYFEIAKQNYDDFLPWVDALRVAEGTGAFDWKYNEPPIIAPDDCYTRIVGNHAYPHCRYPTDIITSLWRQKNTLDGFASNLQADVTQVMRYAKSTHTCEEFDCANWSVFWFTELLTEARRILLEEPVGYNFYQEWYPPGEPKWTLQTRKRDSGSPTNQTPGIGIDLFQGRTVTSQVYYFTLRIYLGSRMYTVGMHWDRGLYYYPDFAEDGRFSFRIPMNKTMLHEIELGDYEVELWYVPPFNDWLGSREPYDAYKHPNARVLHTFTEAELSSPQPYIVEASDLPEVDWAQTEGEVIFQFRDKRERLLHTDFLPGDEFPSIEQLLSKGVPCAQLVTPCYEGTWDEGTTCTDAACRYEVGSGINSPQPWDLYGTPVVNFCAFGRWYPHLGNLTFWP